VPQLLLYDKSKILNPNELPRLEFRNSEIDFVLSLPLLMARILTDDAHNALAANDPAFCADLFN